ncbi:HNH endonuclease [Roseiconus lacunae]|uniref:HNH endonuclease n=1 Tax=Roseiconus lacunae TaxID=2605694 RepID=UPI001E4A301E|nr:HNH endonuclease [Roseiconus lacunae]MCD0459122.1 HNH endonuclease [Roseiconus lacunae]
MSQSHPAIVSLSELLNQLPIHPKRSSSQNFRNPNGVYMKLGNFLRFDPGYSGSGLSRGGKLEAKIWNEFADDHLHLQAVARAIKVGVQSIALDTNIPDDDEVQFPEGRVLYRVHRQRERCARLALRKKETVENLACEVCGFDFGEAYGDVGKGYIECHHTTPVSEYQSDQKTKLKDLVLVCANCHRMLHRKRPWLTVEQLRDSMMIGDAKHCAV